MILTCYVTILLSLYEGAGKMVYHNEWLYIKSGCYYKSKRGGRVDQEWDDGFYYRISIFDTYPDCESI